MMGPKASNFIKVHYPQPVDSLVALLEVMKDPKKFQKHLESIQEYTDKANKTIETLAKAEEVERLLDDANIKNANASKLFDEAKEKADKLYESAANKSASLIANTETNADKLLSEAEAARANAVDDANKALADKLMYEKAAIEVTARIKVITKKEDELADLQKEIDRRKAILAQL